MCSLTVAFAVSYAAGAEPTPTKWTVDGVEREALVYLPSTASKSNPPVIFAFHGHGGNMHFAARGMTFQDHWPQAIVVYPQGLPTPGIIMDREGKQQRADGRLGARTPGAPSPVSRTMTSCSQAATRGCLFSPTPLITAPGTRAAAAASRMRSC